MADWVAPQTRSNTCLTAVIARRRLGLSRQRALYTSREILHRTLELTFGRHWRRLVDAARPLTRHRASVQRRVGAIQTGIRWIDHNNATPIKETFGAVERSGFSRESGRAPLEHYSRLKSVYVARADVEALC